MDPNLLQSFALEDEYTKRYLKKLIDDNNTDVLVRAGILPKDEQNKSLPHLLNAIKIFFDAHNPQPSEPTPNHITCKYCGANNVLSREYQLRSADEGSNLVHECMDCHKSWTV